MTDYYDTSDAHQRIFQARSVLGGIFINFLNKQGNSSRLEDMNMLLPQTNAKRKVYSLNGVWNLQLLHGDYHPECAIGYEQPIAVPASYNELLTEKND